MSLDAVSWAKQKIITMHHSSAVQSKAIAQTPWSSVFVIESENKTFYLKQPAKDLYLEANIIKYLRHNCNITCIPDVIATNDEMYCFLMRKCGDASLRDCFAGSMQEDIFEKGITTYRNLQQATVLHVDQLIELTVPDWRLNNFSKLYKQLISNSDYLSANGLSMRQQKLLHQYSQAVDKLCEKLAKFNIPQCLNHCDLHDNNMLYDYKNKTVSIIDLGEVAISHPFFSLIACLSAAANRYHLAKDSANYNILFKHAFSSWLSSFDETLEAVKVTNLLQPIYLLFAQKRFLDAIELPYDVNNDLSVKQHSRIRDGFIWFIENMQDYNG